MYPGTDTARGCFSGRQLLCVVSASPGRSAVGQGSPPLPNCAQVWRPLPLIRGQAISRLMETPGASGGALSTSAGVAMMSKC